MPNHSPMATLLAALVLCLAGCGGELPDDGQLDGDLDAAAPDDQTAGRQASSSSPLQLFVAHGGSDSADGRTPGAPLATLGGAQAKLRAYLPVIDRNVEIRIAHDGGKAYQGQEVVWDHMSPDYTISFMPSDYQPGARFADLKGRPLFDGKSVCAKKTPATASNGGEFCKFFLIDGKSRPDSRLRFFYLDIRHYTTTAIALHNDGEGRNLVYGCRFEQIGNLYFPSQRFGFCAIGLSSSDHNVIRNNHFIDIRNKPSDDKFMHAVYMNVQSSHNTVTYNDVLRVSGDAMKVRHYSNYNVIEHNVIRYAGVAAFLDWPEGGRRECFSWENVFRHNEVHCSYSGASSEVINLRKPPEPSGGNRLCVSLGHRVLASDNSSSCP